MSLGSFQHTNGVPEGGFLEAVANPVLRNYASDLEDAEDRDSGYVVVIPSLHPGRIAYEPGYQDLMKEVFFMTMMRAWLAYHEALTHTYSQQNKKAICVRIILDIEKKSGPLTAFGTRLQNLKTELRAKTAETHTARANQADEVSRKEKVKKAAKELTARRRDEATDPINKHNVVHRVKYVIYSGGSGVLMVSPSSVWIQARKELDIVLKAGFSKTNPGTAERRQEAENLYEKHLASLWHSNATAGNRVQFINFTENQVPRSSNFYLAAASTADAVKDLPNLVRCFLPAAVRDRYDSSWARAQNHTMQNQAYESIKRWVSSTYGKANEDTPLTEIFEAEWQAHMAATDSNVFEVLGKQESSEEKQKVFSTQDDLNGTEITVNAHWRNYDATVVGFSVSWMNLNGEVCTMEGLPLPKTVMPSSDEEKRFIFL